MNTLTVSPDRLSLMDGLQPFVWRGTLDWPLYGRFLNEGSAVVGAVMDDRVAVGANTLSVGAQLEWWPNLNPTNPAWWNNWRPFADLAMGRQLRLCIAVFCDTVAYPPAGGYQAHLDRLSATLGDYPNVTFVLENQPGHTGQDASIPLRLLKTPAVGAWAPILFARDNPNEAANPTLPPGDFSCYACSRVPDKYQNIGASMEQIVNGWTPRPNLQWPGTHGASLLFEPWHGKTYGPYGDAGLWRQIARSLCFRGTIGGNFYSDQCSQAEILTGIERNCAVEYLGNIPTP